MRHLSRIHFSVSVIAVKTICLWAIFFCFPAVPAWAQDQESKPPGQVAFDRVCKVCHGPEGRGDGAPRLTPFSRDYDEVLGIVREGTGQMPPISAREVSDKEVAAIVDYLKSISQK
jgi:mono/diheme cytochrome c family protein